jgi:hypothetical protein
LSDAAIRPFFPLPEDEFTIVDAIAARLRTELAALIDDKPAATGLCQCRLQRLVDPARIGLLPVG